MHITNYNISTCGVLHPEAPPPHHQPDEERPGVPGSLLHHHHLLLPDWSSPGRSIQKTTLSRDDELLRMLAAAVLAFFLCWAPHQ
ncbi:unnamed protein product, partial [Coregonus sp. 'balchen']